MLIIKKLSRSLLLYILYAIMLPVLTMAQTDLKMEVKLYLEGQKLENSQEITLAAQKYQESLSLNPTFGLAKRRLNVLAPNVLRDHRKVLKIDPGYTLKPSLRDAKAIRGPIQIKDIMPGYLMVYKDAAVGEYALFSLRSRHMHNVHYLLVKEDESWLQYPAITLPGVTRVNDILIYHQPGEALQEGFTQLLIHAFLK